MSDSKEIKIVNRDTWDARIVPPNSDELMARLRAAELPLIESDPDEGESENAKITALIAYVDDQVDAYVATPSGIIYRFTPANFDPEFWGFGLRNYYVVTGNMMDRQKLAERAEVEISKVKGKTISRSKSLEPSGMSLVQILDKVAPSKIQDSLFG